MKDGDMVNQESGVATVVRAQLTNRETTCERCVLGIVVQIVSDIALSNGWPWP